MATFLMLGNYSAKAMEGISAARTKKAESIIKKQNGRVLSLHALLGQFDLALLTELPDTESAMKVSIELGKATGIGFTTLPAVEVQVFDKLAAGR